MKSEAGNSIRRGKAGQLSPQGGFFGGDFTDGERLPGDKKGMAGIPLRGMLKQTGNLEDTNQQEDMQGG